jgi:hypothetical protein
MIFKSKLVLQQTIKRGTSKVQSGLFAVIQIKTNHFWWIDNGSLLKV